MVTAKGTASKTRQITEVKVVPEGDIPILETVTGYFLKNESYDNNKILAMIEAQNPTVVATNWRVLNRRQEAIYTCLTFCNQ